MPRLFLGAGRPLLSLLSTSTPKGIIATNVVGIAESEPYFGKISTYLADGYPAGETRPTQVLLSERPTTGRIKYP